MAQITHEIALGNFYHQVQYALDNYKSHGLKASQFSNVIIGGLGGSGIGGRIARTYFSDKASLPIEVYSDYQLPAYTSKDTLIILSSYSGLTEETLAMYEHTKKLGCTIVCISSGGTLSEEAKANNLPLYPVEDGYQPRMALGFSLTYNLLILGELFGVNVKPELEKASVIYDQEEKHHQQAKDMLAFFSKEGADNKFVIVSDNATEAIGIRFCQQIQENAKVEAFINVLPEANHNAFETYYGKLPTNFIFMSSNTNDRNNGRFAYLKQLLEKQGNLVYDISLKDASISELFRTIYMTDWFSVDLSEFKGADNMSVPNISGLKTFLLTFK
jgi:glucose/mannose-6-phosphate isomerase